MRILLIDDSAAYLEEFAELIADGEFAHAKLDYASNAADGFSFMSRGEHSIYFVDYRLPGDSGVDLIKRAREAGLTLPIICLTGYDNPKLDKAAERAGANGYLAKGGFSAQLLSRTIRYTLRNAANLQAPQEIERRFQLAQAAANIGTWELDLVTDKLSWSIETFRIHGLVPPGEPGLEEAIDFYAPEARGAFRAAIDRAREFGEGFDLELPFICASGRQIWARSIGSVVFSGNSPARLRGTFQDISALVMERLALQHANERITLAVNSGRIGIWEWDIAGDEIIWDSCMSRLYGMEPIARVVAYETWMKHIHADDLAFSVSSLQDAISGKKPFEIEFRVVWSNGSIHYIHATGEITRDSNGTALCMAGTNWDVTETREQAAELARQAELVTAARDEALRANLAKSRFLAGMSHELRTPLNGVLGYAQLLRLGGGLNATQTAYVEAMLNAGNHLLEMISCVLDLSEIESEHVKVQRVEFDLKAIAAACLDLVRPAAEAKGLKLQMTCADGMPRTVFSDPTKLRQVLLNLLGNATKFTSKGEIELRLLSLPDGHGLRVEVADTGPGISAGQRKGLFQEFGRLNADEMKTVEGAGLGLALSARIMALLGGKLGYLERSGQGSIFWLELPQRAGAAPFKASPEKTPGSNTLEDRVKPAFVQPVVTPAAGRILVVDDVEMNRDIACAFLKAAGYEAAAVNGGLEAVQAVMPAGYDLVLMDVQMPGMSGLEAARQIRALPGRRGQIPIIALTAQVFADQLEDCKRAGMESYLAKPFVYEALVAAVAQVLGAARLNATQSEDVSRNEAPAHDFSLSDNKMQTEVPETDEALAESVSGLPVVDRQILTALLIILSQDQLAKILASVIQCIGNGLPGLPATAAERQSLECEMHNLRSKAGTFGLAELAAACRELENALKSNAAVRERYDEASVAMERAVPALDQAVFEIFGPFAGLPDRSTAPPQTRP